MVRVVKHESPQTDGVSSTEAVVAAVVAAVRDRGDAALRELTLEYDGCELDELRVPDSEIEKAIASLDASARADVEYTIDRVRAFAEAQRASLTEFELELSPGVHLGQRLVPVDAVGAYVPGGRYPLLSSAAMAVVPAAVAAVPRIAVCTPPRRDGTVHPTVLASARLAGAHEVYRIGGAQAVAALAYGTETVAPVAKIVGPGNRFVTEAKRQVHGVVGIDLLAGPSEILVVADEDADAELVAADLLAQAEHDVDARALLVTTSVDLADAVLGEIERQLETLPTADVARAAWERRGIVLVADTLEEAIEEANDLAPEHLHVHLRDARVHRDAFRNYGSLFLGAAASVVYSDKMCGTNHILPTRRAARYTGGLWVGALLKVLTYQWLEPEGVAELAPRCARQSRREGLIAHERSAELRLAGWSRSP